MVVRMRSAGPPPFSAPSADIERGANCPPCWLMFSPGKSEKMPRPVAMSELACTVTGKPLLKHTVTSPAAVCRNESVKP